LQKDPQLWSGCISGALTEESFLQGFAEAGFYGMQILKWDAKPWATVEGIEFRSMTIEARKANDGPCFDHNQGVIYLGPFKEVLDDSGHRLARGRRYAVCEKVYRIFKEEPYKQCFAFVDPLTPLPTELVKPFDCSLLRPRHPRETKGEGYNVTAPAGECSGNGGCC
jgi:hypothetical protein